MIRLRRVQIAVAKCRVTELHYENPKSARGLQFVAMTPVERRKLYNALVADQEN
jgi:hypothetical protein